MVLYITYQDTQYILNLRQLKRALKRLLVSVIIVFILATFLLTMCVNFFRFPEKYLTTQRYQLENAINAGNQEAIDYYNRVYVANGIELFED